MTDQQCTFDGAIQLTRVRFLDELHLNKVDVIVQLRPQFHHLDALHDQEKSLSRAQRELENPPPESEARAVNMTVKSSDSDEFDVNEMTRTLKGMQEEPWQHLKWVDQEVRFFRY